MKYIAHIETDFGSKFGVPRQSGLVPQLSARIVFEPEYRIPEAFRGLEGFSHIWLIWEFSEAVRETWSPTVRPPRLGGNERMGVFATRSPFRPNNIGLSCVELEKIDYDGPEAPALIVKGADLMNGTPIFDIKPYIPYADSYPEARGGFTDETSALHAEVIISDAEKARLIREFNLKNPDQGPGRRSLAVTATCDDGGNLGMLKLEGLLATLSQDPRPRYQKDEDRIYGLEFAKVEVKFRAKDGKIEVIDQ